MNPTAHIPHAKSPFKFALTLVSMLSLVASGLVGCDVQPNPTFEHAADESVGFRSLDDVADEIAADPLFTELLDSALISTKQRVVAQVQMTDEELDAFAQTISSPSYVESVDLEVFLDATGVDGSHIVDQVNFVQDLIEKYDLGDLDDEEIRELFELASAKKSSYVEGLIENEIRDVVNPEEPDGTDACEAVCLAQFAVAVSVAFNAYIGVLAVAAGGGPAGPFVVIGATAGYFFALAQAQAALDYCLAVCHGEDPDAEECLFDNDCPSNQFCWTGVIGWGANECRPEKIEGQTCSRHGHCASNCCKLYFWTNPISKTCRPASACN